MFLRRQKTKDQDLLGTLRHFAQEVYSILHIKDLVRSFIKAFLEVAGGSHGSLWLLGEGGKSLELRESHGGDPLVLKFSAADPFVNYLGQTRKILTRSCLLHDGAHLDIKEAGVKFMTSVHAEVLFPLIAEKKFIGIVVLGPRLGNPTYPPDLLELLEVLTTMGAISIDNALLYDSLAKKNIKLSEIAKLKTQFVSTITHELSTPLNGILGLTEVLSQEEVSGPLNSDQKRYLQMICSAAEELSDRVQQIIDLTRFQSSQGTLEVKRVDLGKTLQTLETEFHEVFRQKGMIMEYQCPRPSHVYGDEGQISQVIRSLLENALKFSEGTKGQKGIFIESSRHGDMLKICVQDQGIGIDEKDQEIIFDDFRQADGDLTRSYGGTGLGLALAKKIVELHGGRIWVESKKGEGAQFYFTLPLKPGLVQVKEIDTGRH